MFTEELNVQRWAVPFYLDFLHGNFTRTEKPYSGASLHPCSWEEWRDLLRRELREVTPEVAGDLIMDDDWRTQLCGAYFCGFKRWDDFTLDIGNRLVANRNGFATQGYAFALARMPSHAAANYLCGYLSRVGHRHDTAGWYGSDVKWVVAALQSIDAQMNTHRLEPYVEKLIPLAQKSRFEELRHQYRDASSHFSLLDPAKVEEVERNLLQVEKELETFFLPDDGNRRSEWFWKLMTFCELHFDSPDPQTLFLD